MLVLFQAVCGYFVISSLINFIIYTSKYVELSSKSFYRIYMQ